MPRSSLTECWVGLVLISPEPPTIGHERQVDVDAAAAALLDAHLADRFEEGQRLDVADRAADLDHADVGVAGAEADAADDLVRDVRDDLDRCAEVIAAPLARDDALVDPAGREVAVAAGRRADEALVVPEVEVGFRPVLGDEHLAVLERAHGARVHIDIGVELDHADLEPAALEDRAQAGRGEALPQRGHHATGHEHKSRHWNPRRRSKRREFSLVERADRCQQKCEAVHTRADIRDPADRPFRRSSPPRERPSERPLSAWRRSL